MVGKPVWDGQTFDVSKNEKVKEAEAGAARLAKDPLWVLCEAVKVLYRLVNGRCGHEFYLRKGLAKVKEVQAEVAKRVLGGGEK